MKSTLLSLALCLTLATSVRSQTTQLNGSSLAYRSTGKSSSSAWTLDRDGYLGTYITLAAPGNVTINVKAEGTASGGVNPNMNVVIADTKAGFTVKPGVGNYSNTYRTPGRHLFCPHRVQQRSRPHLPPTEGRQRHGHRREGFECGEQCKRVGRIRHIHRQLPQGKRDRRSFSIGTTGRYASWREPQADRIQLWQRRSRKRTERGR